MSEYKYICEKCNYKTNIRNSFMKHNETILHKTGKRITKKTGRTNHICKLCEYSTINIHNYESNILNNHSTEMKRKEQFIYYCEICHFGTFTKTCYDKHINSKKHVHFIEYNKK